MFVDIISKRPQTLSISNSTLAPIEQVMEVEAALAKTGKPSRATVSKIANFNKVLKIHHTS